MGVLDKDHLLTQDEAALLATLAASPMPAPTLAVLKKVMAAADGHLTALVPVDEALTTEDAARMLNVSRPTVIRLVETGQLSSTPTVGGHRRIPLSEVLTYRDQTQAMANDALDALAELEEQEGDHPDRHSLRPTR